MNRLEAAIRAVMIARNIANLSEVAARIGLQKSALSKIILGQIGLSPTNLRKLVTGISDRPEDQFEILRAHLFEEAERSGYPLSALRIEMGDTPAGAINFADVPPALQHRLRAIATEIVSGKNEDLDAGIRWVASTIDAHHAKEEQQDGGDWPEGFSGGASYDSPKGSIPTSLASDAIAAEDKRTGAPAVEHSAPATRPETYPTRPPRVKK